MSTFLGYRFWGIMVTLDLSQYRFNACAILYNDDKDEQHT